MSERVPTHPICICVELDADFFYLIQSYAERVGLHAVHINRGSDLFKAIHKENPVVILLETDHPGHVPAWEILKHLKENQSTKDIPVVLFSWLNEEEHALQAGADVYLLKPVMFVDFVDALSEAGVCCNGLNLDVPDQKGG